MATPNRPLRPKIQQDSGARGSSVTQSRFTRLPPRNRNKQTVNPNACGVCRRRKTKCDGRYPKCSGCVKLGAACTYSVPRQPPLQNPEADQNGLILHLLRTLPHDKAADLLNTLRSGGWESPSHVITGLSTHETVRALLAPTSGTLELELSVRHPVSYPPLFPLQLASLPLESLLMPSRTLVAREPNEGSPSGQQSMQVTTQLLPTRPLVDERLRKLDMKNWSEVPISNELAASIISLYIETDYQTLPLFDLNLVLEDLIYNQPRFCSSLLVSSLLSWACQAYTAIDPETHVLGRAFFDQAQQLITDGPELFTLTTVSALALLCVAAIGYGRDRLSLQFLQQSITIGTRMGLFGRRSSEESASAWLGDHQDWSSMASYTAWGVHNWASLYWLRYRSSEIDIAPKVPMPTAPTQALDVDGFRACCELWAIFNDIAQEYHHNDKSIRPPYQHEFAEQTYRRLLAWAASLPLHLVRSDRSTHPVMMMHIYFHVIVVELFRHSLTAPQDDYQLRFFDTPRSTPRAVYTASINQLKRLLLKFRLSFETASLSILSQTALIYVGNAVVQEARGSDQLEWHIYLRLCLAAMGDLFGSYRESWTIIRGLLSMAIDRGALSTAEAQRIAQEMRELGQHHEAFDDVDTRSMVDLDLAMTDPTAARGISLAGQFEQLVLGEKPQVPTDKGTNAKT